MLALLRLRLHGKSSVDPSSQPAGREEEVEEEEEEAALLTLGTFCFVCVLEIRGFFPSTGALQLLFLLSSSIVHGVSWVLLHS